MLILTASDVQKALPMGETIEAMKFAYQSLSSGDANIPLRSVLPVDAHEGVSLIMPAYLRSEREEAIAVKIVSLFDQNAVKGLPLIHAAVVVLDVESGRIEAILEGAALTAIRTGAASGAASDILARADAKSVAIIGTGVQARTQLEAVCTVRDIEKAWVYSPETDQANTFVRDLSGKGRIPKSLVATENAQEAVELADIICTATTSKKPVVENEYIKAGTHVNAVGAYTLDSQEIPNALIGRASVFVDSRSACLAESGAIVNSLAEGLVRAEDIAEIGEVLLGRAQGRQSEDEISFFKSVGVAVQDAAAGQLAVRMAGEMNLGIQVDF